MSVATMRAMLRNWGREDAMVVEGEWGDLADGLEVAAEEIRRRKEEDPNFRVISVSAERHPREPHNFRIAIMHARTSD